MKYPYFLKPEGLNEVLNGIYLETLITLPKTPKQPYLEKGIGGVAETIIYIASSVTILCIFGMIISKDNENMADGFKILGGALGVIILGIVIGNSVRDSRKQDFDRKQYLYYKEKTSYDRKLKIAEEIKSNINYLDKNEKTICLTLSLPNCRSNS
ncbi:MAG: hypothetical protein RLZZ118_1905 [Bacteroidota bacterium]|jgi:hypothetical protein